MAQTLSFHNVKNLGQGAPNSKEETSGLNETRDIYFGERGNFFGPRETTILQRYNTTEILLGVYLKGTAHFNEARRKTNF